MKNRPTRITHSIQLGQRQPFGLWIVACLAIATQSMPVQAGPPTAADDIDYAGSGFELPSGVNPTEWATAAGVSAVGGMNYASQPAISGPMMGAPMMMNGVPGNGPVMARSPTLAQAAMMRQAAWKQQQALGPRPPGALPMSGAPMGSPMSMMAMGMPGMGPNGPMMGRPGMEGPMMGPSQMQGMQMPGGQMPGASSIPSSFPSGPIPGMNGVMPTGMQVPYGQNPYGVVPVGFHGQSYGCDGSCGDPACGGYASYESCGCDGGCDGACGSGGGRRFKGLLSLFSKECNQCNGYGCKSCAEKSLQNDCIGYGGLFGDLVDGSCMDRGRNSDLGLMMGGIGSNLSLLSDCLSPYSEAGKCSQRWYDISAEYMALTSNFSQGGGAVTSRGIDGERVLSYGDAGASDLASGVRLSAAVIMGVGSNIEVTYMGGHEWSDSASVTGAEDLFSFISDFGLTPAGGLDDTDRSLSQSLEAKTRFHSGEVNYRRRIVGPQCKFQGSWLFGMRYIRFDNDLAYDTVGTQDNGAGGIVGTPAAGTLTTLRFFNSDVRTKNDFFGAQLGYDFWWNVTPGVHFGIEAKGAWMQNDWERNINLFANSAGPGATSGSASASDRDRLGTVMGDLQTTLLYRFSHEWTFRSSYHLMAIDDVVQNTLTARTNVVTPGTDPIANVADTPVSFGSAVIQGFTVGMEYLW